MRLVQKDFGVKVIEWLELNSEIINHMFIEENLNIFNIHILRLFTSLRHSSNKSILQANGAKRIDKDALYDQKDLFAIVEDRQITGKNNR